MGVGVGVGVGGKRGGDGGVRREVVEGGRVGGMRGRAGGGMG